MKRYVLKDRAKQARLDHETGGEFSAGLQAYFKNSGKSLLSVQMQKSVSIMATGRRVSLNPAEIECTKHYVLTEKAVQMIFRTATVLTPRRLEYAERTLRDDCFRFEAAPDGTPMLRLCYVMTVWEDGRANQYAIDPELVTVRDE